MRDYKNYFGQTSEPFIVVSQFELSKDLLRIVFDGYSSTDSFDANDEPLSNLRRVFQIEGDRLRDIRIENGEIFESIKTNSLEIAQVPGDYEFVFLNFAISKAVMVIHAARKSKDDSIVRTKTAPEYHEIVANNIELVSQVLSLAWTFGKEHDVWLRSLSPLSENSSKIIRK